ncbi:MAG: energy transducer TonB, partial [Terracidiphilus sp.]
MFEDSTFESMGKIHTRSRRWMIAVFLFNTSILLAMILIPLLRPEALPKLAGIFLMQAPPLQQQQPAKPPTAQTATQPTEIQGGVALMPRQIPDHIWTPDTQEPPVEISIIGPGGGTPGGYDGLPSGNQPAPRVVRPAVSGPIHVPSTSEAVLLIQKTIPIYPPIARAARIEGTVRLAATISKAGTIENLRVTGGPAMLQ